MSEPKINKNGFHANGAPKHAGGRPSSFKDEYCEGIIDFFTVPTYRQVLVKRITSPKGQVTEEYIEKGGDLPFLSQYAHKIGVTTKCMGEWADKYPEFGNAYNRAKELQCNHLVQNGIQDNYNAAFGIFTAKNITLMRDQPTTVINNENHTHYVKLELNGKGVDDLIYMATGRVAVKQ